MVFTAPAVHYSALATEPPELGSSSTSASMKYTAAVQNRFGRILKRLLFHDQPAERADTAATSKTCEVLSTAVTRLDDRGSDAGEIADREAKERLPFTEPYSPVSPKLENCLEITPSAYQKHCIRQAKYIEQKQYRHRRSSLPVKSPSLMNLLNLSSVDEHSQTMIDHEASSSVENSIGLHYALRRSSDHPTRSLHAQPPSSALRRLHSKPKTRSLSNVTPTSVSSSIAHRIELLKQAMEHNGCDLHQRPSTNVTSNGTPPPVPMIVFHRQTQTNGHLSQPSALHHIHHHHIHSSSLLAFEWRTGLSVVGTVLVMLLLLAEFITVDC